MDRNANQKQRYWFLFFSLCVWILSSPFALSSEKYVVALYLTPVLNTPDMESVFGGRDGRILAADELGAVRALEFIAFPGTVFTVLDEMSVQGEIVYRVQTAEYPYASETGYFVSSRFVQDLPEGGPARTVQLLSADKIQNRMNSWIGLPYVWGGNAPQGVPGLLSYFAVRPDDPQDLLDQWMLKGLDCSGLLYAATDGWTPRNTSALVNYGDPVEIEGLSVADIMLHVKPLDVIVWPGHVVIVLDDQNVIESRMDHDPETPGKQGGVRVRPLEERMKEIFMERVPANDYSACDSYQECFVIRRWHGSKDKPGNI